MKKMKMLSTTAFRLLALMLCLAATVPQLQAQTYTVAGTPAAVLGTEWDPSNTSNDMVRMGSTTYYYLARTANVNGGSYAFKITKDHSWGTSYPGSNYNYSVSSTGTWSIVYIFNTSGNAVSLFGPFKTLTVAGSQTEILGSSWGQTDANNDMTTSDGVNYTLSFTDVNVTAGNYQFKVVQDHAWTNAWPSSNYNYSVGFTGLADVVYSFNVITKEVSVNVTEKSVTPTTPDYYITGSNELGLGGFSYQNLTTMTYDDVNEVYTYSYNVTTPGTYYFAFADGPGNDWTDFNSNHRYGPASGNQTVTLGSWATTQKGAGSYAVTLDAGQVTITFDVANMTFKVEGTAPVTNYFVKGADTNIFPDGWATNSNTAQMTETGNGTGIYTWTSGEFHANAGTSYTYKVYGSDGTWHPLNSGNQTFSAEVPGTYTVTITYDSNNETVTAQLNTVQLDQANTFNIYVRYTGTEDLENVYTHAWDTAGDKTQWPGTSFESAGYTIINGYRYYTYTFTSYDATLGLLFNENGSAQTADLTATPGDNYFTYGGGSTVDGPNSQADARTEMYLIGYANSQQWAANNGIPMEWDEDNNYYKLERVVLTSRSNFAFATQLAETSDDWDTLNAHRLISTGESNWNITVDQLDTWIKYDDFVNSDNHNWYVEQAGSYDIYVDPGTRRIMVATRHEDMYISHGVNWNYQTNSDQMTTVDGNVYQATITLNQGDFFLFSTDLNDDSAWGADIESGSYEITDLMINFAQKLKPGSTNNFYFNGTTGKYIVVVNKAKKTVTLRKTYDATKTKIYLQKTPNVTLDAAGGTYNNQPVAGKRGGIYAWNKLNLESQNDQAYTWAVNHGPTNYTYDGEVGNDYGGDGYLKDMNDTITYDGKEWYAWSVSNSICEFYFIRNNQTDYKSQNIIRRAGEVWLTWIDEDATFNRQDNAQHLDSLMDVTREYYDVTTSGVSDCATMLEGHYYVYYTNTTGWDSVYCYAWHTDPLIEYNGVYPGGKCTFAGYDKDGYEVWCYDFGLIDEFNQPEPTGVIFNNGRGGEAEGQAGDAVRQQTGDMEFDNGACYDYLGMIYLGNSLNAIINGGVVNGPKYTVEDDLIGVYYDDDAITLIKAVDHEGNEIPYYVRGALYAKDVENYSAKSRLAEGTTDYVYDICSHWVSEQYPGGSQVQLKRTYYDQSNWVKIVLSPNFDNTNAKSNADVTIDASQFDTMTYHGTEQLTEGYLKRYVGKIIPGHSMSGNLVNNVNPQMHITNIARPVATPEYEKNVYITTHFNDTVVFSYTHPEWNPDTYKGVYKRVPHLAVDEETGEYIIDSNGNYFIDYTEVLTDQLYKMFYVAPKPQEIAYITWAVFDHSDPNVGTSTCEEPSTPGAFYAPMNWNRTGQLWGDPNDPDAAWGTTYGPFSNGYMQYGAFQVNWSLFGDENHVNDSGQPWYRIFKPGQAYKILALIRYAYGKDHNDVEYTPGIGDEGYDGEYHEGGGNHVFNAPRRADYDDVPSMAIVPYDDLNTSKFIVFPLMGTAEDSNGSGMGNVTGVKEVQTARTVTGVHYYNLMGVRSDKPFDGINIVVTTYSDGSRTSKKILR